MFTYEDFIQEVDNREAIIKALNRMIMVGKIAMLSKGKYYKLEKTPFGELVPEQYQVVKDLLEVNDKPTGYLTGYGIFNKLKLTRQVSNTIQIGKNETSLSHQRERYTIVYLKQKNTITKENIPLLQLLDVIYLIKKIPGTTPSSACKQLLNLIKDQFVFLGDEKITHKF